MVAINSDDSRAHLWEQGRPSNESTTTATTRQKTADGHQKQNRRAIGAQHRSSAARVAGRAATQSWAFLCYKKALALLLFVYYINTTAARRAATQRRAT